jgi:hypothetical protein
MIARVVFGLVVALGLAAPVARADEPLAGVEIVVAKVTSKRAARHLVVRAAHALGYRAAAWTTHQVPARDAYAGPIVSAHALGHGQIAIVSFLGEAADAPGQLREAQRHFPQARAVPAWLPPENIDEITDPGFDPMGDLYVPARVLVIASSRSEAVALRAARRFNARSADPDLRGTVVPSEDYETLTPNLYVVVAGPFLRGDDANGRLREARAYAPDAYLKRTLHFTACRS